MRLLVVGPTSFLGRPLVQALLDRGVEPVLLTRDPRKVPDAWRRLQCHWGPAREGHVLHQALEGVDRVVACLHHGVSPRTAMAAELETTRDLVHALARHGSIDLVKLTTPPPLLQADFWAMSTRRRADLLAGSGCVEACLVEVGWVAEALRPLVRGGTLWLPHPVECPGPIAWQSLDRAVASLAELVLRPKLPRRVRLEGEDRASLDAVSARLCVRHPALQRIFLPPRIFRWMERIRPDFAYVGQMLTHAGRHNPAGADRPGREDAFADFTP